MVLHLYHVAPDPAFQFQTIWVREATWVPGVGAGENGIGSVHAVITNASLYPQAL